MPATVDVEGVVGDLLAANEEIEALVGERVVGQMPADTGSPWIQFVLLGDPSNDVARHLVRATLQLDCYAGADESSAYEEASLIGRTVTGVLNDLSNGLHDEAVVSTAEAFGSRIPDPDFAPTRQRWIVTATVWLHAR